MFQLRTYTACTDFCHLDVLRALHIIPREPTPLPIEDRPIEDLNHDETREVLRLYKVSSPLYQNFSHY